MKVLDLFSGIGGFSLGLEWAGMSTVAMCEKDPYCRKILAKHWPHLTIHEDIRNLDGKQYADSIDVVCGGFPCQPFSVAGKQRGSDDDRHLWPEMLRVIQESKPRWVIGENVFGFINMELDNVQADLEREHYTVRKFVLPAVAVDAHHRRDRIFIISYANSPAVWDISERQAQGRDHFQAVRQTFTPDDGKAQPLAYSDNRHWSRKNKGVLGKQSGETSDRFTGSGEDVAYSHDTGIQGSTKPRSHGEIGKESHDQHLERCSRSSVRLSNTQRQTCWLPEPNVGRVAHGVPNRVDRLRGLGNAVVPQLVQAIGELVLAADKEIYDVN